jgi:phage-related protein
VSEIVYYTLPHGEQPVRTYIDNLDKKLKAKTFRSLLLLEENGALLREPDSKHINDGIFELRTSFGGNAGRILFFFTDGEKIVATHGFLKKSRRTPTREIVKAKRYRADYFTRKGGGSHE